MCDLGADRIWVYAFDETRGALFGAVNSPRHCVFPTGSGPRHLAFHPTENLVFVSCELSGEITTCQWDEPSGRLTIVHSVSILPTGVACSRAHHSGLSHVECSASGKAVYALSRTDNAIVALRVVTSAGQHRGGSSASLDFLQRVSTRGVRPRHFLLRGDALYVVNQDTSTVAAFAVDAASGRLSEEPGAVVDTVGVCPWVAIEVPVAVVVCIKPWI